MARWGLDTLPDYCRKSKVESRRNTPAPALHSAGRVRLLQGREQSFRFVDGLLVFPGGNGIGNDPRACLDVGRASLGYQGANGDAGIKIAGVIQVEDGAAVDR